MEIIKDAVGTLAAVCMMISFMDCLIEDSEHAESFRLLCSTVVVGTLIKSAAETLRPLLRG